jgi:hypothetical protein
MAVVQHTVYIGFDDQGGHEKCMRARTAAKSSYHFGRNEAVEYRDIELYALRDNEYPVEWSLGGAGYNAIRNAFGGTLRLDAEADVGVKVSAWQEKARFKGGGICASIRL